MSTRYQKIVDTDGNDIGFDIAEGAYLEKLDGRNPLFKYYKYRFYIRGHKMSSKFLAWMRENFGSSMSYNLAKHNVKCNVNLENVPWVHQVDINSYHHYNYIYFNKDCEVLIRLKFMSGAVL